MRSIDGGSSKVTLQRCFEAMQLIRTQHCDALSSSYLLPSCWLTRCVRYVTTVPCQRSRRRTTRGNKPRGGAGAAWRAHQRPSLLSIVRSARRKAGCCVQSEFGFVLPRYDGQGSGSDFNSNVWDPPFGWVNNQDGGRTNNLWVPTHVTSMGRRNRCMHAYF